MSILTMIVEPTLLLCDENTAVSVISDD